MHSHTKLSHLEMKLPPSVINPWYQSESAHPPRNEWKTCSKIFVQSAKRKVKHNHIIFARKIQKNLNNLLIYETSLKFFFLEKILSSRLTERTNIFWRGEYIRLWCLTLLTTPHTSPNPTKMKVNHVANYYSNIPFSPHRYTKKKKKKKIPNTGPDHLYRRTFLGAKIHSREGNKQSEGP